MNHRPFEGWLLENKRLNANEKRHLDAHLQDCISCTSLAEVNLALKSVKMAAPAAGFIDRFEARLRTQKQLIQRRNFWGFFILMSCVSIALSIILWPFLFSFIQTPADWLGAWLDSLLSFWAVLAAMIQAGAVWYRVAPGFLPWFLWIIFLLIVVGWSLIWVLSLIKLDKLPQGVKQ